MANIVPPFPIYGVPIILASRSPRRIELMQQLGLNFTVRDAGEVEEVYSPELKREAVPLYLAQLKANAFLSAIPVSPETIVITADTIVWLNDRVIGKPSGRRDAIDMLKELSGNMHEVYTGVCINRDKKQKLFFAESRVYFRKLTDEEIIFYVDSYHPFDKAGAYGIQEWIGYVAIEKIEGSYFNVMGLPVQKLYRELNTLLEES